MVPVSATVMASADDKIDVTYVSPEEVRSALLSADQPAGGAIGGVVVVDVRDGDFAGEWVGG